jgi:hypothetical protein
MMTEELDEDREEKTGNTILSELLHRRKFHYILLGEIKPVR